MTSLLWNLTGVRGLSLSPALLRPDSLFLTWHTNWSQCQAGSHRCQLQAESPTDQARLETLTHDWNSDMDRDGYIDSIAEPDDDTSSTKQMGSTHPQCGDSPCCMRELGKAA
jgi:hypothetical protein